MISARSGSDVRWGNSDNSHMVMRAAERVVSAMRQITTFCMNVQIQSLQTHTGTYRHIHTEARAYAVGVIKSRHYVARNTLMVLLSPANKSIIYLRTA